MVVSRSESKKRRKEGNTLDDSLSESPKRTKVHAQRKFAQGSSNISSPVITPIKDKDRVKNAAPVLSPELIPSQRPRTEDFLTFLCFRGKQLLPPSLEFFNVAVPVQESPDEDHQSLQQGECSNVRPVRSDTNVCSSSLRRNARSNVETGRKAHIAVQALKKKYQEQRLAKQRTNLSKLVQKVKGKNMIRTRSSVRQQQVNKSRNTRPVLQTSRQLINRSIKKVEIRKTVKSGKYLINARTKTRGKVINYKKRHSVSSSANSSGRSGLRSGGSLPSKIERALNKTEHSQPNKPLSKEAKAKTNKNNVCTLSDFSSDDDQPLSKKLKPVERNQQRHTRKVIKRIVQGAKKMKSRMMTRSCLTEKETKQASPPVNRISSRPTRKTKEAAALYMELLGKKLTNPEAEVDEDSLSIDSFPELPNARQNERRENELKAKALKEKEISNSPKALRSKGDVRNKDKKNLDESGHKMTNKTKKPSNKVETVNIEERKKQELKKHKESSEINTNIHKKRNKPVISKGKSKLKRIDVNKETFVNKVSSDNKPQISVNDGKGKTRLSLKKIASTEEITNEELTSKVKKCEIIHPEDKCNKVNSEENYVKPKKNMKQNDVLAESKKQSKRCTAVKQKNNLSQNHTESAYDSKIKCSHINEKSNLVETKMKEETITKVNLNTITKSNLELLKNIEPSSLKIVSVRQNEDSLRKKPLELSPNTNISTLTKSKAELVENKSHVKSKETFSKKIRRKHEVSLLKGAFKEENETKLRIDSTIKHNEDFLDYKEEDKELKAGDNIKMEDIVAMQESVKKSASLKKKDTSEKVKESENVNQNEEVLEDKSNTILLLRRRQMLRRVSRLSNCSNTTTSETARRTLQSQSSSSSPPQRPLCQSKAQDSTSSCSDKFSDSDEEPLGKIALKSLSKTKKSSVSLTSLVIKNKNNSVENELKKNDNIQDNNTLNLRRKDDFNENHHSSVLRSYDKRKKTSLQEKQTKSSISQQRCTRLESEKNEIKRRLKEDQTHQACNADTLSSNQEKSQTLEEKTINKSNKQDISKTENTKKLQPDSLLDEFPLFKISNISLMDVGKTSTSPGNHSAPILKVPIISLTQHVVRDVLKMTTTMKSKLVAQSKKTCLQKMDQVSCKSASPSSSSSVPNNSNVGTKYSNNILEELECDLRQELNISDIVETLSGKSEPMVKAQVDDSYVKRMKGQINPPLSEEQAILHGGLATVALKNTIENTSSSYSYSLSKKSHVSKIKKQDVDNKRQSVFVRLSKKSPRKQIGPCKVSGGASNSIDKVNKPGHNTTVPKQVGNFSLVHDVDLDIKKLPRNNTAQRYFSDTKLYQSDLGKCSNKTSHIGIVKNKEMVFKSLGSGDVERKISKCENSKINQSLSSFSNLLIPSTSSAKKPTYKDLKAHRKVNMSTEQIEKWLSESFADDSDEEECLSCSKPKCICSQTALDEELAHLSQYAMEKLSLGNSSECEGLDENKKKLDKSVVGTPFYLKEGDLSRTSEKITTFCLDDFKQKLVQEETNAEPEQPITLKKEINFGEMTTVTSPSTFINKDINIVKDINGPGKTPANNYTHNKDSSSSLEKNLKAYVTSQEEFDTDEVFSTSNSNGKQPVTLLQLPLSSSKTNCLQSSTSFCDTVKNTKVKPLQIISLLNQQTTNSTFDETATPTSKDIGNSLVEHASKTTSMILPPQYTPTSVNWDFVESSPSKKLISSGQVDTESITSTKPTKEKSVTPSTQSNTRPVAHETNQSHCTNSATQQPLKSLSDQSVSKTLENISGSTTKHTEQSSIPLVHYSTNSQVQHPSSERLSLLPLVYTSSGAQQPVICTSGDSTVPHLMYTISASEQTSTPQLCYTSSGVMPSSYSTPVCTMVPPLVYTSSFTQQETKCTPDQSTILPLQYTNSSSQQAITFNVGQPISSTAPQIANSNVQQIPTSLAQQVITSSLQHPISSSVETPLNTSITPSVNSSLQQLITSSPQQTKILMVQQPITSVKQISSIHQPILSSIPNQNMSSVQQPVSSSFQHAVNVPFQQVISSSQLTQPVSASLQQTSRTALHQAIALPLQQPLSQLFQQSVNSSFQQSGGFILQQTSAAPLQQTVGSPFQQSISLQLQQQTLGIPCHQTVTVPLQQLTFVPIKSVNLQLQQQIGNIPLQSISSSHPQTITAYGAQSVPLQKPINNLTVQHHTPGIQHSQSIHLPLQQPATNLQVQQASGNILLQQTSATSFSFQQQTITPQQQSNDASIQHQSTNILQSSNSLQQSLPHMQENIIQSTATQQPNSLQHSSSSSQHPTPLQQSSSVQQSNLFTQLETSVAQPSQTLIQQPTSLQEPMSNQQLSLLQQSVASFEEQAPLQQSITSFQPQTSLLQSENSFQQSNAITQQIPFQHSATLVQQPIPLQALAPAQELTYIQQSTPIKESSSSQELVPIQQSDCLEQPTSTQHSTLIQQSTPIQVSSSLQELVPIQQSTYLEQPTSTQQSTPIQESIPIQHSSSTDLSNSLQQSVSMQQSTPIQHTVCNKDSTSLQQSISFMQQPSSLQQTTCQPSLTLSNQFIPLQESTPCTAVQLSTSPKQPTPLEQPFSPKCSTYIQQSTSPKPSITQSTSPKQSITQSTSPKQSITQSTSPKQSITQSTSPRQSITQTTSPKQSITESTYAKQSTLPRQSTPLKQSTLPQQSTPPKQVTLLRQSTPIKQSILPRQLTPLKQSTLPQQSTPLKQSTLPQQSTPLKQSTLPQQSTPLKHLTLSQQLTPPKQPTLPQQSTPIKQPTLPPQPTLLKQSTLPQQSTSLKQSTLPQQSTPIKQPTLPQQSTPIKQSILPQQSTSLKQSTLSQRSTSSKQSTGPQQSAPLKQSTLSPQPTSSKQCIPLQQSPIILQSLPPQIPIPSTVQHSLSLKQSITQTSNQDQTPQLSTPTTSSFNPIDQQSTILLHKQKKDLTQLANKSAQHSTNLSTNPQLTLSKHSSTVGILAEQCLTGQSSESSLGQTGCSLSQQITPHSVTDSLLNGNTATISSKQCTNTSSHQHLGCTRPVEVDVTVPFTNKETVSLSKEADKNRTNKHLKNTLPGNSSHSAGIKSFRHAHKAASHNTVLSNKLLASHKNVKDSTGGGLGSKRQRTPDKSPERKSIFHQRRFAHKLKERKDFTPSASAFSPENESSVYAFEMESELPPINTPFRRRARDSRTSSTNTSKSEEDLSKSLDDESPPPSTYYAQSEKSVPQSVEVDKNVTTSSQQCQVMLVTKAKISPVESSLCRGSASIAVQVNLDNEPLVETQPPSFSLSDAGVVEALPQRSIECSTQTEVTENEEEDDSDGHMFYIPLGGTDTSQSQQLSVAVKLGTEGPTGPNQRVIMSAKLVTKPPCFNRTSTNVQDAKVAGGRRSSLLSQHQRPTGILMMEQKNQFSPSTSSSSTSTSGTYPPVGTVQPTTRARPTITSVASQSKMDATTDTSLVKTTDSEIHHNIEEISSNIQTTVVSKKPCATVIAASKVQPKSGVTVREKRGSNDSQNNVGTVRPSTSKAQQGNVGKLPRGTTDQSPSVSSTSGNNKRGLTKSKMSRSCESVYVGTPVKVPSFPSTGGPAQLVEAPTYRPTEKEFQDPLEYIDKIRPVAEKFGLCRIVPPPNFKPECKVTDDMRFTAYNQYVHKMLHRWGPNVKEMMAIKKYLATQSISLTHPPWVGGMEVDLPRLYQTVQSVGGLKEVIEKKRWQRVADAMKIPKSAQDRVTKLDDIYCKYLLPYDTLSPGERQKLFDDVEKEWAARDVRVLTQDNSGSSDSNEEEVDDIQDESEECIVKGRNMPLNAFYRIARNTMSMWFRQPEPPATEVEQEFWKHVMTRQCHVCVHSGSIDSSGWGYGFPCSKNSPFARHPWNLKVLTNNSGSVLRSMGPIMGVTVPTLHVGMLFTTCCWYRDPHGLPWIEYLHTGASKIWYGIPDEYSCLFRSALEKLVPRYCRDRTIWLPSDTAMVPPSLLVKEGVSLCHTVQEPGQFILVFPRAFTSSVCTGYLVSESVYFAQPNWLTTAEQVFKDIQESCESSMVSLERLLFSIATDARSHVEVLRQVLPMVVRIRQQELSYRQELLTLGLKMSERLPLPEASGKRRKSRPARDEEGDYECEICRANLFVSLVTNSHEEGVYCLPHAIQLLTNKRHHLKFCKLMYTYDESELDDLIKKIKDKIEVKSQKKSQSRHGSSSQRI